jgi:hypothetical protein
LHCSIRFENQNCIIMRKLFHSSNYFQYLNISSLFFADSTFSASLECLSSIWKTEKGCEFENPQRLHLCEKLLLTKSSYFQPTSSLLHGTPSCWHFAIHFPFETVNTTTWETYFGWRISCVGSSCLPKWPKQQDECNLKRSQIVSSTKYK